MHRIIAYTHAYNADKTLERAVESIVCQNFCGYAPAYILINNGSTDKTGELIDMYANTYDWIVPIHNEVNISSQFSRKIENILDEYHDDGFLFLLDADDEYKSDFLERAVEFVNSHELDIVVCGSDFVDAKTKKICGTRNLAQKLVVSSHGFSDYFTEYHQFMRTVWGKVFSLSLLRKCSFGHLRQLTYGRDTAFTIEAFKHSERVGILPGTFHKYYVSVKSASNQFDNQRIKSDQVQDKITRSFLHDKCGKISQRNNEFLMAVYFHAINDTMKVLLKSQVSAKEKLSGLCDIYESEQTQELIQWNGLVVEKSQMFKSVRDFVASLKYARMPEEAKSAARVIAAMHPGLLGHENPNILEALLVNLPELVECLIRKDYTHIQSRLKAWHKKSKQDNPALSELEILASQALEQSDDMMFMILANIKKRRPVSCEKLNVDARISKLLAREPITSTITPSLAVVFLRAVCEILGNELAKAFEHFVAAMENAEIQECDMESFMLLGQNLAAACEQTEYYVHFKKIWISFLLDSKRFGEAKKELDEWGALLPNDADIMELQSRYDKEH